MSEQSQHQHESDTSFRQRLDEAMMAEVRVRIPDADAPGGYREEWWSMQRVYDVAWAAASDFMITAADEAQNIIDDQDQ